MLEQLKDLLELLDANVNHFADAPEAQTEFLVAKSRVGSMIQGLEKSRPKIAIVVGGGMVDATVSDTPELFDNVDVIVMNYDEFASIGPDFEGVRRAGKVSVRRQDGLYATQAFAHLRQIDPSGINLDGVLQQLEEKTNGFY